MATSRAGRRRRSFRGERAEAVGVDSVDAPGDVGQQTARRGVRRQVDEEREARPRQQGGRGPRHAQGRRAARASSTRGTLGANVLRELGGPPPLAGIRNGCALATPNVSEADRRTPSRRDTRGRCRGQPDRLAPQSAPATRAESMVTRDILERHHQMLPRDRVADQRVPHHEVIGPYEARDGGHDEDGARREGDLRAPSKEHAGQQHVPHPHRTQQGAASEPIAEDTEHGRRERAEELERREGGEGNTDPVSTSARTSRGSASPSRTPTRSAGSAGHWNRKLRTRKGANGGGCVWRSQRQRRQGPRRHVPRGAREKESGSMRITGSRCAGSGLKPTPSARTAPTTASLNGVRTDTRPSRQT